MRKVIIVIAIVLLSMIGPALAADINIKPDSGAYVKPDGTIMVPIDVDAATSIGLGAEYLGFNTGNAYTQHIEFQSVVIAGTLSAGTLTGVSSELIPIHWTPTSLDIGKTFTIVAEGWTGSGARTKKIEVAAPGEPVPEMSTGLLMSVGLIGLVGLTRYRRKE